MSYDIFKKDIINIIKHKFKNAEFRNKNFPQKKCAITFNCLSMQVMKKIRKKSNEETLRQWCNRKLDKWTEMNS